MPDEKKCKIVVFGAFGAGKTTLIKTVDPVSHHIEAQCAGGTTTIALDFGKLHANGCGIYIFGTPGQERYEFAREIIGKGMDGAILLIDATSPPDAFIQHLYDSLIDAKVPFRIFLNKCNRPGADQKRYQDLFKSAPIRPVSALDRGEIAAALLEFAMTLEPHPSGHPHLAEH